MAKTIIDLIQKKDLAGIEKMLKTDPSLANSDPGSDQPLHLAAGNNDPALVKLLVRYGADVNSKDEDDRTPLHRAAELGPESVEVLLQHGADPNTYDRHGYTPLAWAISGQQDEGKKTAKLLRAGGARYGLLEATAMGDLPTIRKIFTDDPRAVESLPSQDTLLSMAWTVGQFGKLEDRVEIIRLFIEHRLKVPKRQLLGHARAAETRGKHAIADLLKNYATSCE